MPRCTWLPPRASRSPKEAMRFSIQSTPMRVDLRPDLRPFAVSSQADGGLPRRPRRCAAGLGAASAFLGVFGGENEEGARNTYVAGILLAEANGSNQILRYYVYGQGLLAMVTPAGASYSYHYDATGNTVAMTDGSQAVVNRYAYTPYGQIVGKAETPGLTQPFQYVGQSGVMAEPNGFYYMRARYYDPKVGRFLSEDPIGFDGGDVNLYAYVGGNPVMGIDPFGLAYRQQRPLDKFGLRNTTVGPLHHDRFLYDNGDDSGYYRDSTVGDDRSSLVGKYQNVGEHLDDDLLRQAETNVSQFWDRSEYPDVEKYELLWHNCQDYCDAVIAEYDVLKAMREFGSVTSHIGSTASSGSSSPAGKRF